MEKKEDTSVNELLESIKDIDSEKLCSLILALADNDKERFQEISKTDSVNCN
ncbi:MAG: hypothetical protein KAG61_08420 [Bacteriovoracaceae bacterium]|nr:hypothetical protein [Bacteriovoracaceae bacterium]